MPLLTSSLVLPKLAELSSLDKELVWEGRLQGHNRPRHSQMRPIFTSFRFSDTFFPRQKTPPNPTKLERNKYFQLGPKPLM